MKTQITFVLDSSGSMSAIRDDTIGGFNTFVDDQRDEPGTATVALYEFDTTVTCHFRDRPIEDAPKLDEQSYRPGGRTALHDAIATAVEETATRVDRTNDSERPDNVIVVVLTDGKENASETPQETVRELVEYRREEHGWEFLFVGANQDAALTAGRVGIDPGHSLDMTHSGDGTEAAYASTSKNISTARREGRTGGFDEEDRRRQEELDGS